ncbi:MAG: menaquinone biosynthesis protein [Acidobacteria bacterium]|nr:menaquinone biosynthesis protein [Acidobacteriota bacterium]
MRIAASTYLNSAPLVQSFATNAFGARYLFLGDAAPSRCAAMLAAKQADIALIPVIEYQRIPNLLVIPNVAVAAKRQVRSVLLAARKPLPDVTTLALDTSSRTSQALVQIILAERYGVKPHLIEHTPRLNAAFALGEADAALFIGDPALCLTTQAEALGLTIYDLAEEWQSLTGLPFVFAVWAVRAESLTVEPSQLVRDFLEAKAEGLRRVPDIAAQFAAELSLPLPDLLNYLHVNVNYDLDEANRTGLERYYELAATHGLIEAAHPVRFLTA